MKNKLERNQERPRRIRCRKYKTMIKDILKCIPFCKIIIYSIVFFVLFSIVTSLQGCTTLKSVAYWYEHSENMRMPDHIENNMIGPDHIVPEQSITRSD